MAQKWPKKARGCPKKSQKIPKKSKKWPKQSHKAPRNYENSKKIKKMAKNGPTEPRVIALKKSTNALKMSKRVKGGSKKKNMPPGDGR